MKLKSLVVVLIGCFLFVSYAVAQDADNTNTFAKKTTLGLSVQGYPAGIIPTVNLERYISQKSSFLYRLGANIVDRQDFSDENDNEEGVGFGGSFGYRKHYPVGKNKIIAGLNLDIWNLWIDWRDNSTTPNPTSGSTYTLVVQPWLEAGYFLNFKNGSSLGITGGFGREINAITNGDDVAQGFIGSISVQYYFVL